MQLNLVFTIVLCATPSDAELIETLSAAWRGQRSAIATAHIRYRSFRSSDVKPISGQEVDAVFNAVDLVAQPDDLRRVVVALWKYTEVPHKPWALVEVSISGSKVRERTLNELGDLDNLVDQGITVVGTDRGNQTSILRTSDSRWRIRRLNDFRFLPVLANARITGRESGRVHITEPDEPREETEVDETTGFAHSWRLYIGGLLNQEILQFGPVVYPGDVLLPTVIAKLGYREERLRHAEVFVIEQADVNIDLPADAFVAKVPKGTLIVDARDPHKRRAWRTKSNIDDAVHAFPLVSASQPTTYSRPKMIVVALLAIGAVMVALLMFFYRRPRLER